MYIHQISIPGFVFGLTTITVVFVCYMCNLMSHIESFWKHVWSPFFCVFLKKVTILHYNHYFTYAYSYTSFLRVCFYNSNQANFPVYKKAFDIVSLQLMKFRGIWRITTRYYINLSIYISTSGYIQYKMDIYRLNFNSGVLYSGKLPFQ